MNTDDTIVAVASPPGAAARGIVRLSGPAAFAIAHQIFKPPNHLDNKSAVLPSEQASDQCPAPVEERDSSSPATHKVADPIWQDGTLEFESFEVNGSLARFPAVKSFTGQPSVEFHLLGAPTLLGWLIEQCLSLGARQAGPGEFTARAFLAGRLDLSQVHGVAGLIAANNDGQLRAAERLLHGDLSRVALDAREQLADLISLVEGALDFADEPIEFITVQDLQQRLADAHATLKRTSAAGVRAERWEAVPRVVLVGKPNAGKSSLFNALLGADRAMATPIAGTTRDSLTAQLSLPQGACRLVDVAGWETASTNIEASAQAIAEREAADAALSVLVVDLSTFNPEDIAFTLSRLKTPTLIVGNKSDAVNQQVIDQFFTTMSDAARIMEHGHVAKCLTVSATANDGVERLRQAIADVLGTTGDNGMQHAIALLAEHRQSLESALESIERARSLARQCDESLEDADLVALEMRAAAEFLGQLVGMDQTEETLGRIFSRFCVGK